MAAISALASYGNDSSEDEEETKATTEEMTMHLKPLGTSSKKVSVKSGMEVVAAPQIVTKVSLTAFVRETKSRNRMFLQLTKLAGQTCFLKFDCFLG